MLLRTLTLLIAFGITLTAQAGSSDPMPLEELAQAGGVAKILSDGAAFLAANKQKRGVTVLPSGLQYKVIKVGTGKRPNASDRVVVHYRGTSIDGKEFDSSYSRGQPATFPVNRVIPGWTEALQQMRIGAKWQVAIPSNLAYGKRGAGGVIGPDETLLFDIELLEIK